MSHTRDEETAQDEPAPSRSGNPVSNPPGWAWWVIGIVIPVLGIAATVWTTSTKTTSSSPPPAQTPRTTPPDTSALGQAPNQAPPASSSPTGAVPAVFLGVWEGSIGDDVGEHHRRITIRQGKVGDEMVTTRTTSTATGSTIQCRGTGTLVAADSNTIELDTMVTESIPSGRCNSVGEQTLTLLDENRVRYQTGLATGILTRQR
ncbi:hypothetical protein [Streptomyces sp. INR7]|uniref:hypothetical protein n=1 Tax=Streptomyces TaxID=1883 RepID=UPI000A63AA1F|nr:hypothetical protein [Streptomyces sp. INR7]QNE23934.1 hypothetical protein F1D59_03290 [Streptomyces sp. INR7]